MSDAWALWVLTAGSALHVVEEHGLGWQGWANAVLGPSLGVHPKWADFWITNAAMIIFAISAAVVGWQAPGYALGLPALQLINAAGFHILPSVRAHRPNPGLFSAILIYIPVSIWCYAAAGHDGVLSVPTVLLSVLVGAASMAFPLFVLRFGPQLGYPDSTTAAPRS